MRGKEQNPHRAACSIRITPAYAGKSSLSSGFQMHSQDHPRLCGEKMSKYDKEERLKGSPPPMRGKVLACRLFAAVLWITPAYAGKSFDTDDPEVQRRDHPRLCGEKGFRLPVLPHR